MVIAALKVMPSSIGIPTASQCLTVVVAVVVETVKGVH